MGEFKFHDLSRFEEEQSAHFNTDSIELQQAIRTSILSKFYLDDLKASSEVAILLVPFNDGPYNTLHTISKTTSSSREGTNFDNIIPIYLIHSDTPRAFPLCSIKTIESLFRKAFPMTSFYEGGRGETLINSIKTLNRNSDTSHFYGMNVRIQKTRFYHIQTSLLEFDSKMELDYGYAEDSLEKPDCTHFLFPGEDLGQTEIELQSVALLRQLLYHSGKYGESPLSNIEILRASMIGLIDDFSMDGIQKDNIFNKSLYHVYDSCLYLRDLPPAHRYVFTFDIMNNMVNSQMLKFENNTYNKGEKWDRMETIIKCYLDFYRDKKPLDGWG